jgi:hypothetical protein
MFSKASNRSSYDLACQYEKSLGCLYILYFLTTLLILMILPLILMKIKMGAGLDL